jgi:ribonuclease HI
MKTLTVYVDGSWRPSTPNRIGSGVVVVENDEIIEEFMFYRDNEEMARMRQICGELVASMESVRIAIERGYEKIIINYDYEGIKKWYTKEWKRKNKYTQMYQRYMEEMSEKINIEFVWVKGHSKNVFNEYADYLAKKSLEL